MSVRARLARLERRRSGPRFDPEDCPGATTWTVFDDDPVPDDAPCCPLCGEPHVVRVIEEVVSDREQADRAIAELCAASGVQRL
jgi:hypothetical protein